MCLVWGEDPLFTDFVLQSGVPTPAGHFQVIQISGTGQDVPVDDLAYISSSQQYFNISGQIQTAVDTDTDFTNTNIWARIGDGGGTGITPDNYIPINIGGEFGDSGIRLSRPQLLDELNQQWFLHSSTTARIHEFVAVRGTTGIVLDGDNPDATPNPIIGDSFNPNDSALSTYAFRDSGGLADALLFNVGENGQSIANELAGETVNTDGGIHTLAIGVNVAMSERNNEENVFFVLGPFTRYQWLADGPGDTSLLKLFPNDGNTLATIHQSGCLLYTSPSPRDS